MSDEIQLMQDGVRDWVQQTARRGKSGLRTASPAVLLSLLCASAFGPLFMAGGVVGAGIAVLSSVGGGMLTQVVSDALNRLRQHGSAPEPSREDLEKGIAQQVQQILAHEDERADALRREIASVLKKIDAGGTALRAAMEAANERVRNDVIAAIGVLGSDFSEMGFLLKDVAQAAAEIQRSLDVQGADVRAIIEQNEHQSADIRLVREDLAVIAGRAGAGAPAGAGRGDGGVRWVRGCPYRGLLSFDESDADVFYGRERLATELAVKLVTRVTRGGLVVVMGASGAGKSSLLRAGLLPILARGQQVEGSDQWPRIVMTPTKDPLTELAARLAALGGNNTTAVHDELAQHPDRGHLAVWPAVLAVSARRGKAPVTSADKAARLVLIVDQFEQVFTLNAGLDGEAARQAFIAALCAAAANPVGPRQEPPALVVIAVRGDFWDRCAAYPQLKDALQDGQFVVGPMTESELRVAITGPADAAGLTIDPALTDTILGDLEAAGSDDTSGVLPLLSQAMSLTWEQRDGARLTSHGYAQAGGVSHAVQTGADKVYDALPAGQQELARDMLRSMTVTSRDGRLTRRPVTRDDLYSGLPRGRHSDIDTILDAFAAERLVVLDGDTAQISHDVLLRAWPRLRGWLEEDQATWIVHGQLADAAAAWRDSREDPSFLYRGTQLAALQQAVTEWSASPARSPALTSTQRGFLQASERAAARSSRRRRSAFAILVLLTVLAVAASGVALYQRAVAIDQRDQAIASQVLAESVQYSASDLPLSAQLALAAYRLQPTQDFASRLLNTENTPLSAPLTVSSAPVISVAFSPSGRTLATADYDGTVRLWNVADPAHPRLLSQPLTDGSNGLGVAVALSANGHTLASVPVGGDAVQLWDTADPAHPRLLAKLGARPGATVESAAFSPGGQTLAIGGETNQNAILQLWDVADPAHPAALAELQGSSNSDVVSVAFSPGGQTLAAGDDGDGLISLWNVIHPAKPRLLAQLQTTWYTVWSVAFGQNGNTLANGDGDGSLELWNVTDPANPSLDGQLLGSNALVSSAAYSPGMYSVIFSPDGDTLASGNPSGIRLLDVTDPAHPRPLGLPLANGSTAVESVAFSRDGRTLAAGNDDGTVRLWTLPQTVLVGNGTSVASVAFSPNGQILASGNDADAVQLWDSADPAHPRPLGQPLVGDGSAVTSVAFSHNGGTLASGHFDGTLELWDVTDPADPGMLSQTLNTHIGSVESVAFSPNGRTLAVGEDAGIQLWDVTDPANPQLLATSTFVNSPVYSVAFSPDSRTLATGDVSGTVQLWDVTDPAHPRLGQTLTASAGPVHSVAFSHNGRTLASGGPTQASGDHGGTIQLWDVTDPAHPRRLGQPLTGSTPVLSVAFSLDGRTLASGDYDGTIQLWDVIDPTSPRTLGQPLTISTGPVYSVAFSPDGHTLASGDDEGTTQLWNLNVQYAVGRICATAGQLTPRQWNQYIHQLGYRTSCAP